MPRNLALGGDWRGFATVPTHSPGAPGEKGGSDSDATCAAQIAYADRIVLNKMDLVGTEAKTTEEVGELVSLLRTINSLAEIRCVERAQVVLVTFGPLDVAN